MTEVKVICDETRYVGNDYYKAGATYTMDAERAGKYSQSFRPVSDADRDEAMIAWSMRMEQVGEEMETRNLLQNVDPSLVKAAIIALREQIVSGQQPVKATAAAKGATA